jgi:hypothetical protein
MSILYKLFFAFMVIAFSGSSNAELITIDGSHVSFSYDDSQPDLAIFGAPTVSGDSLSFMSPNFSASSTTSSPFDFTNRSFAVTINSLGNYINKISLVESGNYIKIGGSADVAAGGSLTTIDLTNTLTSHSDITPTAAFATTNFPNPVGNWEATANENLLNSFSVLANINNILGTQKLQASDFALINKLSLSLTASTVSQVPLPQAVWLFGAGLLGMLKLSKRKNLL